MSQKYSRIVLQTNFEEEKVQTLDEVLVSLPKIPPALEKAMVQVSGFTIEEVLPVIDKLVKEPVFVQSSYLPGDIYKGVFRKHVIVLHPFIDFHPVRKHLEENGYNLGSYLSFTLGAAGYTIEATFQKKDSTVNIKAIYGIDVLNLEPRGRDPITGEEIGERETFDPDKLVEFREIIILRQRDLKNPNEWLGVDLAEGKIIEDSKAYIRAVTFSQLEGLGEK